MTTTIRSICTTIAALAVALVIVGCGGDDPATAADGGAGDASLDPLLAELKADGHDWDTIERYEDGSLRALGRLDAQGRPHGAWRWWYPEGGRWWDATCVAGAFDPSQPWTLYNGDGSVRAASGDGLPPEEPPL